MRVLKGPNSNFTIKQYNRKVSCLNKQLLYELLLKESCVEVGQCNMTVQHEFEGGKRLYTTVIKGIAKGSL